MSVIGVLYCAYQTADLVPRSLGPWIEARRQSLAGHTFKICAVSIPFEGFDTTSEPEDDTRAILGTHAHAGEIDHAIVRDKPMKETEARGMALKWLVEQGVETLIQWDSDEIATVEEIGRILAFIEARPLVAWHRLSYRNIVFTPEQYLAEPFQPARVHKVRVKDMTASGFYEDNNVFYTDPAGRLVYDRELASVTIPPSIAWIDHWTWLSDLRSKRKVAYQMNRWKKCSFEWDTVADILRFNPMYPPPEVLRK